MTPYGIITVPVTYVNDKSQVLLIVGVVIHSVLFGFCLATTALCLHYMIRRRTGLVPDYIMIAFLVILLAYNIVVFGINVSECLKTFHWLLGYLQQPQPITGPLMDNTATLAFEVVFTPTFLWISDAFLIWRCWVVWIDHRWVIVIPGVVWLASVITGIVWSIEGTEQLSAFVKDAGSSNHLTDAVFDWIPAIAFSCGLDVITTSMIAGRLLYFHRRQRTMASSLPKGLYISIVAICIESAMLSTLSKFLQLFVPGIKRSSYAIVPLCTIASTLILIRKVLGADLVRIQQSLSSTDHAVPASRLGHRRNLSGRTVVGTPMNMDTLSTRFDGMLAEAVGGKVLDINSKTSSGTCNAESDRVKVAINGGRGDAELEDPTCSEGEGNEKMV